MSEEDLHELASLFAEFDGAVKGFIHPHTMRSLVRRIGRVMKPVELCDALDKLAERRQRQPGREGLDFIDVVDFVSGVMGVEVEQLRGIVERVGGGGALRLSLQQLAAELKTIGVRPPVEHLRRTIADLRLGDDDLVVFHGEERLRQLTEKCRLLEKQRALERAGFTLDEVAVYRSAFDRAPKCSNGEVQIKALLNVLDLLNVTAFMRDDKVHLEEMVRDADRDENGTFSFEEVIQLVRRFFDEQAVESTICTRRAAQAADMSEDDVEGLRGVYDVMRQESSNGVFAFPALLKSVSLFGARVGVAENRELDRMFQQHALPSRVRVYDYTPPPSRKGGSRRAIPVEENKSCRLHLHFAEFLSIIGQLWDKDFGGILTASETWLSEEGYSGHVRRSRHIAALH